MDRWIGRKRAYIRLARLRVYLSNRCPSVKAMEKNMKIDLTKLLSLKVPASGAAKVGTGEPS
jgi:hypothetical protein